jgi:hypothetical protein
MGQVRYRKSFNQLTRIFSFFNTQKIVSLTLRNMSWAQDPRSGMRENLTADPGVKKASDPGSTTPIRTEHGDTKEPGIITLSYSKIS